MFHALPRFTSCQQGVTLIELIIVVGIVALVSSVLIFNYSDFSNNVSLRNLSQEIALSIRKAQTYATSVQAISGSGSSSNVFPTYGISFSLDTTSPDNFTPSQKRFVLFADIPASAGSVGNRLYDKQSACGVPEYGNECVESFGINSADRIVSLCTDVGGCVSSGTVNLVFRRPSPDASICIVQGSSCNSTTPSYIEVTIRSAKGKEKTVTVWNTGQISVE